MIFEDTFIQVCGCCESECEVAPFACDEEADFFGVYVGVPGAYSWVADFAIKSDALHYANAKAAEHGYKVSDDTYQRNGNTHEHH